MAHVYREMDAGRMASQEGTRRVYVLRQIGDIITVAEIEKRLIELEEKHAAGPQGRTFNQPARLN